MEHINNLSEPSLLMGEHTAAVLRSIARTAMKQAPEVVNKLLGEIDRADVIAEADLPDDVVTLGSFVTYQVRLSGSINTIKLVCPHEADPAQLRVSIVSGLGTALIGLSSGQQISCELGGQRYILEVIRVSNAP